MAAKCEHGDLDRTEKGKCRICRRAHQKAYYEANPGKEAQYREAMRRERPEAWRARLDYLKASAARRKERDVEAFLKECRERRLRNYAEKPEQYRGYARKAYHKGRALAAGYTTAEASGILCMEMRDLLSRSGDLARIFGVNGFEKVKAEGGYRWPRGAVEEMKVKMFSVKEGRWGK